MDRIKQYRYRATICVDVWSDDKEGAEKKVGGIVSRLPNSFQVAVSRLPHGSSLSLTEENHDRQV